jgi:hypothetical protein
LLEAVDVGASWSSGLRARATGGGREGAEAKIAATAAEPRPANGNLERAPELTAAAEASLMWMQGNGDDSWRDELE